MKLNFSVENDLNYGKIMTLGYQDGDKWREIVSQYKDEEDLIKQISKAIIAINRELESDTL